MVTDTSSSPNVATLKTGGDLYHGWTSLKAVRSIEQMAGSFSVGLAENWSDDGSTLPILPGASAQLQLDGTPLITGWIDDAGPDFDASSHSVSISGRDKTADLVDCSAIHGSGQWSNASLERIGRDLIKPFGIDLVMEVSDKKKFPSFSIHPGETVFETLERAARLRALLLTSNADGNLVITRASSTSIPVRLEEGVNIVKASGRFSWKERFSKYVLRGQDNGFDEDSAHVEATATDSTVSRYRPLIVLAEDNVSISTLKDRAAWEASVRRGRSKRATITVEGWRRPDGVLWEPNVCIRVTSKKLWLDADMLIVACEYTLDENGTQTTLTICDPEAFQLVSGMGLSLLERKINDKTHQDKKHSGVNWDAM